MGSGCYGAVLRFRENSQSTSHNQVITVHRARGIISVPSFAHQVRTRGVAESVAELQTAK
ncbi:hypothetical protein SMC6_08280 [Candidatus Cryosericum odellii]|uniref:Uncharacterized protein n=1 Tax=Candidatus Cryosericum odellii TaxID=2290917 RepID=A0A398D252_9BACT|nr:hypothetical protein SMC6_08280 [Candidatus Cryosericum odellii]RIE07594.1 hypothetical protein SMC5_09415 [Candidatus Cryosericum odellii]